MQIGIPKIVLKILFQNDEFQLDMAGFSKRVQNYD